jgi:hypothetical protein
MFAQDIQEPQIDPGMLTVKNPSAKVPAPAGSGIAATTSLLATTSKLTYWSYSFVSPRDGATYQGTVVGGNPLNRGARTTTIPVVLVPIRVQYTGTVRTFDPTSPDVGCLGTGNTALSLLQASPLFNPVPYTINGVNVGTTTFPDAFQRASFWTGAVSNVSPAYHLAFNVSVGAKQSISIVNGSTNGATFTIAGDCSTNAATADNPARLGLVNINFLDPLLNTMIANMGITANQFPFFVLYGVVISDGAANTTANCCILGYHSNTSAIADPLNPGQTYGIGEYDQGYLFGGTNDVSAISHEFMEWINDPSGANPTPPWGNIGQVGGCQNNLEVGDPLSGTLMPNVVVGGKTYHIQEQAFFSWLLGTPAIGAGGKFSSNGTFGGDAKLCPPGGTN